MDPRPGDLSCYTEALDGSSSIGVGGNPAHQIVGRWGDRNEVMLGIDARVLTHLENPRKSLREGGTDGRPGVQKDFSAILLMSPQGAGDEMTRGQIPCSRIRIAHEDRVPSPIHETGSFSPQRLGNKREWITVHPEGRRVELDKLHSSKPGPYLHAKGDPVSPSPGWVGGPMIQAASPSRG
jgi:hypothetical protein